MQTKDLSFKEFKKYQHEADFVAFKTVTEKSGIGLQNVKRRLDLSYPDNYELTIQDLPNRYVVELKMNLI